MIRQLPISQWPRGLEEVIFTFRRSIEDVARRLNATVESERDDLDEFAAILVEVGSGPDRSAVVFQAYQNAPIKAINVLLNPNRTTLKYLADRLDFDPSEIGWINEDHRPLMDEVMSRYAQLSAK